MNAAESHFSRDINATDKALAEVLANEARRQQDQIELIASENLVSRAVLQALGSQLTNKTVEGYPGARYHGGAEFVDIAERLAIDRACKLFGVRYANVQPHSGSQANQTVFLALLKTGDTVLSLALPAGGHLSHGAPPNMSGKWFNAIAYGVDPETGLIDYPQAERLAREHRPKLIITGGSAYPRVIDFARFRAIAESVGAVLLVDMAHFAGLVAAGAHPSPVPHAHIVTCTTTKTLRGPRGGMVMTNDPTLAKKIDAAVFPGVQGSVHLSNVAAKAVCLGEALRPEFKEYGRRVIDNARALAAALTEGGVEVLTGGTDTHLLLVSLRESGVSGSRAESILAAAGITCNKNPTPSDPPAPARWTGLRFGTAAGTTRDFGVTEFEEIGAIVARLMVVAADSESDLAAAAAVAHAAAEVSALCERFPLYPSDWPVRYLDGSLQV